MSFGGFPANLGYHVTRLENYAKQPIKFWSNRGTQVINHGDTIRFSVPKNSLIDLKSISLYYKGTCPEVGDNGNHQNRFFPRLSSSVIQSMSIYTNGGQLIQTIDEYGLLYNLLHDFCGGNKDGKTLENTDPSLKFSMTNGGNFTAFKTTGDTSTDLSDKDRQFVINTWLGFLNGTTQYFDTNNAELEIEIRLAPASILWNSAPPTAGAVVSPSPASYTLKDVYITCDRINFHEPLYYNIISQKLLSSGLEVGFDSYSVHIGSQATDKQTNMSFSVNARNLAMLICTGLLTNRTSTILNENYLVLQNAAGSADSTFDEVISTLGGTATDNTGVTFNNSKYFARKGNGILTSQIEVNSIATSPWPLTPHEIFNQNLINFNQNSDMMSYLHKGIISLDHFMRDYFFHSVSFEHRGAPQDMQVGLDGKSSSIDVKWTVTAEAGCGDFMPLVFAVKKEIMKVHAGHQIEILR